MSDFKIPTVNDYPIEQCDMCEAITKDYEELHEEYEKLLAFARKIAKNLEPSRRCAIQMNVDAIRLLDELGEAG